MDPKADWEWERKATLRVLRPSVQALRWLVNGSSTHPSLRRDAARLPALLAKCGALGIGDHELCRQARSLLAELVTAEEALMQSLEGAMQACDATALGQLLERREAMGFDAPRHHRAATEAQALREELTADQERMARRRQVREALETAVREAARLRAKGRGRNPSSSSSSSSSSSRSGDGGDLGSDYLGRADRVREQLQSAIAAVEEAGAADSTGGGASASDLVAARTLLETLLLPLAASLAALHAALARGTPAALSDALQGARALGLTARDSPVLALAAAWSRECDELAKQLRDAVAAVAAGEEGGGDDAGARLGAALGAVGAMPELDLGAEPALHEARRLLAAHEARAVRAQRSQAARAIARRRRASAAAISCSPAAAATAHPPGTALLRRASLRSTAAARAALRCRRASAEPRAMLVLAPTDAAAPSASSKPPPPTPPPQVGPSLSELRQSRRKLSVRARTLLLGSVGESGSSAAKGPTARQGAHEARTPSREQLRQFTRHPLKLALGHTDSKMIASGSNIKPRRLLL